MPTQLSLQNLSLSAAQPLVDDLSLTLRRGQALALVGASGSGKSLTCAAALGVLPAGVRQTAGAVLIDSQPVSPQALRGVTVATVMQNPRSAFNPLRTMADHVRESCLALGKPFSEAHAIAALEQVGLRDARRVLALHAFEMSGGMLQRVMIALALLAEAPFLIADEPTTDLDAIAQANILDLLDSLMQQRQPGMLLVTHDMGVVARLADEVAVMDNGRIIERGAVGAIFHSPQHPLTRQLVSAHLALYGMELAQ